MIFCRKAGYPISYMASSSAYRGVTLLFSQQTFRWRGLSWPKFYWAYKYIFKHSTSDLLVSTWGDDSQPIWLRGFSRQIFLKASQTLPSQSSHPLSLRSHAFTSTEGSGEDGMICKCQTAAADDITTRFLRWRSHYPDRCCRYGNLGLSAFLPNVTLRTKFGLAQLSITSFFSPVTI